MYKLAHWIKDNIPFLWNFFEFLNSVLFNARYGKRLKNVNTVISSYPCDFFIREATIKDVEGIVSFFKEQPKDAFKYFSPHRFDSKTISKLIKRKSYLFFIVLGPQQQIIGYFFLRCFFNGNCFRGKIVDYRWRNRGIATIMGAITTRIAQDLGLRMFGTISKSNIASFASSSAANEIKVLEELPNDYLYVEYLPK